MPLNPALKADGTLVLVTLMAASGWFFSRFALHGLPIFFFVGSRFLMAGLVLGVLGRGQLSQLSGRDVWQAGITGIAMCLSITLWTEGLQLSENLGVGVFICSLGNILAPLLGWVLFKIRISPVTWVAVSIATVGTACLSLRSGLGFSAADLYFLASAGANSLHLNLNNRYALRIPVLPLVAIQLIVVGVSDLMIAPFRERWPDEVSPETIGWFLCSVLIATSLRYFLLVTGQKTAPISHTALIMNLEPVWTALLGGCFSGNDRRRNSAHRLRVDFSRVAAPSSSLVPAE
jgi:drug/metabolite transporter (DMT)-like permease